MSQIVARLMLGTSRTMAMGGAASHAARREY